MDFGDVLAENRNGMIATHIVFSEMYAPRRVYPDRELAAVAIADMRVARQHWRAGGAPFGSLCHFAHRLAADDPPVGLKALVDPFIVAAQDVGRHARCGGCKSAGMKTAVDHRILMDDDLRSLIRCIPRL